jgi:DNA-binding NarL/FixJ family response regulator
MVAGRVAATAIRLVIVADVRLYCDGLAAVLPRDRLLVVGTADSRATASAIVQAASPDVVLVDVATAEAFDLMRQLRTDPPPVGIIAFGVGDDISTIVECAEAGAIAYVPATAAVEELVATVECAVAGELRCPPKVAGELFRRAGDRSRAVAISTRGADEPVLTGRQRQVHAMLRQSLSNKEIAVALNISEATVKNHVHKILEKLQVPTRVKAATCLPRPKRAALRSQSGSESSMGAQTVLPLAIA